MELYPHQQKAVNELSNGKVLYADPGTGKTMTALAYYFTKECGGVIGDYGSMRHPRSLVVITTAKKRNSLDWQKDAAQLGLSDSNIHPISGVSFAVDSWNNVGKYVDYEDTFFIFDEQRIVGKGAWSKAFLKIAKHNRWIVLTATPGDTWLEYIPLFVANGFYKNRTAFMHEHVQLSRFTKYPKVERYLGVQTLIRRRDEILVRMPYKRHTRRWIHEVEVDHDTELLQEVEKKRWHVYEGRPLRDVAELFIVMRKVVNSHTSRLQAVETLLHTHPKVIVFYNHDPELMRLRELGTSLMTSSQNSETGSRGNSKSSSTDGLTTLETSLNGNVSPVVTDTLKQMSTETASFAVAEYNGHKHEDPPDTDSWLYFVQYAAGSEAWNCVETDAVVFFSLTYSYKQYEQAQGRIDRLNTPYDDLYYYVLKSKSWIDSQIWAALRSKKSFNESAYKHLF